MGRITDLLKNGKLLDDLGIENIAKETDRAMVCGSIGLNTDLKENLSLVKNNITNENEYAI